MDTQVPLGPPELNKEPQPIDNSAAEGSKAPTIQLIKSTQAHTTAAIDDENNDDSPWVEPDELNEHVEEPNDPDGVLAAEQEQRYHQQHPETPAPKAKKRHKHRFLKFLIFLIVVAAAGYGAFWFGNRQAGKNTPQHTTAKPAPAQTKPTTASTKQYTSQNFSLDFTYPADWVVQDSASKLTVTSPAISLVAVGGARTQAHVVVTIQNQQTAIAGYPSAGATAVITSDKLTYVKPTNIQRAQTYLSYLGYASTNGLDAVFVTGDNGYQQGQNIPQSDVIKGNPLVSVNFQTCPSADCSHGASPVSLLATDWKSNSASKAIIDLLQSIQLN